MTPMHIIIIIDMMFILFTNLARTRARESLYVLYSSTDRQSLWADQIM